MSIEIKYHRLDIPISFYPNITIKRDIKIYSGTDADIDNAFDYICFVPDDQISDYPWWWIPSKKYRSLPPHVAWWIKNYIKKDRQNFKSHREYEGDSVYIAKPWRGYANEHDLYETTLYKLVFADGRWKYCDSLPRTLYIERKFKLIYI